MNDQSKSWISDNGLKVEGRSSSKIFLSWEVSPMINHQKSQRGSNVSISDHDSNEIVINESVANEESVNVKPWYELRMKKSGDSEWITIYKGYNQKFTVKRLPSEALLYFSMKKSSQDKWGSNIIAATDTTLPSVKDLHHAIHCNAEEIVEQIIKTSTPQHLRRLLESVGHSGENALEIAEKLSFTNIYQSLIAAGAKITSRSRKLDHNYNYN